MNTKSLIIGLIIGTALGSASINFAQVSRINELQDSLIVQETIASERLSQLEDANEDLEALEAKLIDMNERINSLQSRINELKQCVNDFGRINDTTAYVTHESRWNNVTSFVYQLQNIDLEEIRVTNCDLVIIDYSAEGDEESRFTRDEITRLKESGKLVLAYMSIGEAEDYRWYWEEYWDPDYDYDRPPDLEPPSWLGPSNPEWAGNYKVRYWEPGWQYIIYGSDDSYLDKIIETGFDGVYLDIIDAYEYWGPGGKSGLNRETAEIEMVKFVISISDYASETKSQDDFGVFPQNGEALSVHLEYVEAVNGIGREDVWYNDNMPQPISYTNEVIQHLFIFKQENKTVLVTDYLSNKELVVAFYNKASEYGFVPYTTIRDLDELSEPYSP